VVRVLGHRAVLHGLARPCERGRRMKNRLRVLRAERAWSQGDLAERLEVSRQSVNAIETGRYDPSLPLAFKIADLFGMTIEEIFTNPTKESGE
jgi:putative transcriptional regulator